MDARENPKPKLELELRRGAVLAVLSQLRVVQYAYSLRQAPARRGMSIRKLPRQADISKVELPTTS